jgi:hypothetical protein
MASVYSKAKSFAHPGDEVSRKVTTIIKEFETEVRNAALAAPASGKRDAEFYRGRLHEFLLMKKERPINPGYWDMHEERELRAALATADEEGGPKRGLAHLARCPECHSADIIATGDATFPWECCACDGHMRFSTPYVAAAPPPREREAGKETKNG